MNPGRKNTLILGFTLLVVMLGYGMVQPIIPFLITELGASGKDLGVLTSVYAVMQLIFAPVWGSLSDRWGRKPVLLVGTLGYALALFIFGLATRFWMLFVARTFSGVLSSAVMPAAMAYLSDNLPENERSKAMGQLGAAVGLGVVFGPLLAGLLSSDSLSLPFFVGSGLALLALLLVYLLLPESHPAKAGQPSAAGATEAARRPSFWRRELLQNLLSSPAGMLMLLVFIMSFGLTNFQGIVGLYAVQRFAFDTAQVGVIWMVVGAVMMVSQGVLTGLLSRAWGDVTLIRLGLLAGAVGFAGMLYADGFVTFLLATGFLVLSIALIGPALNAQLSVYAGAHQGALMGLNAASASLGRVIGPLWAGFIFDVNIHYPFASGAVTLLAAFVFSVVGLTAAKHNTPLPRPHRR